MVPFFFLLRCGNGCQSIEPDGYGICVWYFKKQFTEIEKFRKTIFRATRIKMMAKSQKQLAKYADKKRFDSCYIRFHSYNFFSKMKEINLKISSVK